MNKKYLAVIIAVMTVMAGCGKVNGSNAATEGESSERNKSIELREPGVSENPTDEETTADEDEENEAATDEETTVDEEYIKEILGDGSYGFELYNDGHIAKSWEHRMEAAPILLTAAAQKGLEDTMTDTAYSTEQLNGFETSGFMTYMKFEEEKDFRIGGTIIKGNSLTAAGENGEYHLWVDYFDENGEQVSSPCFDFDEKYIDRMMAAMETETQTSQYVTGSVDIPDASGDEMIVAAYNGEYPITDMNTKKIVEITLEALNDPETAEHTLNQMISDEWSRECIDSGLDIEIIMTYGLDSALDIENLDASAVTSRFIQICGKDGTYSIAVDNGSEMELAPEYAERLIHEGLNR